MPQTVNDMRVLPDDGRLLGRVLLNAVLVAEPGPQLAGLLDAIGTASLNYVQKAQLVQAWDVRWHGPWLVVARLRPACFAQAIGDGVQSC
jgi:hypothetical protein